MNKQVQRPLRANGDDLKLAVELFYRQYEILYRLTTQMLATKNLDDKLSLVLDAVTSELGYSHAALALIDHDTGELRIRMAIGFENDDALTGIVVPGPLGFPVGALSLEGRPVWIERSSGGADADFLQSLH